MVALEEGRGIWIRGLVRQSPVEMVPGFPETCDYGNQVEVVLTIMEEVQQTIKHQSFKLKPLSSVNAPLV